MEGDSWQAYGHHLKTPKKFIVIIVFLLLVAFGSGFCSGVITGIWATRTEVKKPCHPLDVDCKK